MFVRLDGKWFSVVWPVSTLVLGLEKYTLLAEGMYANGGFSAAL